MTMNTMEIACPSGTLRLATRSLADAMVLRRAAQRIRWLPGVLTVAEDSGELEVVFRGAADELVRRIHQALAGGRCGYQGFPEP